MRKQKSSDGQGSQTRNIITLIGGIVIILAVIILITLNKKLPLCSDSNASLDLCNGAISLEQKATMLAQTQIAIIQTLALTPSPNPTLNPMSTPKGIPWATPMAWDGEVDAEKSWQDTGIELEANTTIVIEVIDGKWTGFKGSSPYNRGSGTGFICGKAMSPSDCVEPLPMFSSDALIGRVGDQLFYIGQKVTLVTEQAGMLSLRMNDGEGTLYDNEGSLKVAIALLEE
jgi:hypothetical protein